MEKLLIQRARMLVKDRIPGRRIGQEAELFLHSWRVGDLLREHGFSEEVQIAGLFHDITEDGGVSFDELKAFGCSEHVCRLVWLASHEDEAGSYEARQVLMFAGLIKANDLEAWAIKVADSIDNLRDCWSLEREDRVLYVEVHAQLLVQLAEPSLHGHPILSLLVREIAQQKTLLLSG